VYAVEGFLRRLAASEYVSKMTLKGGMLLAALSARRMTRDADLATVGLDNDERAVAAVVAEIAVTVLEVDDGLEFDVATVRTEVMREDAEYHGVRVKLTAGLATAKITTTLDFSFGDPHRSAVIELLELLGTGSIRLASYPPELSLAEKVATMMSRRELNMRDRDFAEVWVLSRVHSFVAGDLRAAILEVADHRRHEVTPRVVGVGPCRRRPRRRQQDSCCCVSARSSPKGNARDAGGGRSPCLRRTRPSSSESTMNAITSSVSTRFAPVAVV
jgi:Nucleotidyl transferase AbiEii toxin, Type IV TA system